MSKKLTRREFLKRSAIVGASAAALPILNACAPATPAPAPASSSAASSAASKASSASSAAFDWKRFKGEKIEFLGAVGPFAELVKANIAEFQDLTGITVGFDAPPEQQQRQKMFVEFASGNPSFDVVAYSFHVHKRLMEKSKWTTDLRKYLDDPTMTSPDFDWSDFSAGAKGFATAPDGRVTAIPQKIDLWILYYNKEILQKKGVAVPKTFDEMIEAAKKLHDPANNVYGFAARGLKNANVPVWTSLMLGWEKFAIDDKGTNNTESAEAIAAATLYQTLLKNYAPPGVTGFNWNECQSLFALGQLAMWFDGIGWATPLEDATKSKVNGKVGYALPPAGPKGQHAGLFIDGVAISANSKKQGPAWYFVQWINNKKNNARFFSSGGGAVSRASTYSDPEATKSMAVPKEWVDTLLAASKNALPSLPIIAPVTEFRDIFGVALNNMIGGADVAAELKKANAEFKPIYEKSEQS